VVTDLLHQFHDVTGEQHGGAGGGQPGEQPADDVGGYRVHALQRLVEEQHGRVVDQGAAERGLLPHAGGVVGDQPPGIGGEIEQGKQFSGPGAGRRGRQAAQPPGVLQQFGAAEPLEQPGPGRHHPNARLGGAGIGPHVEPVDHHLAAVRPQQPGHHRQGRGFARPVRADQPGTRPGRDVQVDPGDRLLRAEALAQPAHHDCRLAHAPS
jgi:hypothetical protein